jgi:predicted transcriptional regulator
MNPHHLILGTIKDFLTGEKIEDNHDERYRQKIAKILVNEKGFKKNEIKKDLKIPVKINNIKALIPIDYTIYLNSKPAMIIKYGPGSIVSREKPAIACSRLLYKEEVPITIVTNGEDAEIIDTKTGMIIKRGLDSILKKNELINFLRDYEKKIINKDIKDKAEKILFAFEVNDRCPCDDSICKTKEA